MLPSASELVARFLRTNGYDETLASFIQEAGLPSDAGDVSRSTITIEQILHEKKTFDLSLNFEKLGVEDSHIWQHPSPSIPNILSSTPTRSNILSVHSVDVALCEGAEAQTYVAATTADRRLHLLDPMASSFKLLQSYDSFIDSPVLDLITIDSVHIIAALMSGKLVLYNIATRTVVGERRDHSKYVVKLASCLYSDSTIVASAGWDSRIFLYRLKSRKGQIPQLREPIASITLPSIPENVTFVDTPDSSPSVLLLTRKDSTFLFYYSLYQGAEESPCWNISLLGKQNLAPHSNAWVAFTPSDVQICPTDPSMAAIATSSTPHMRLLIVRLLIPPISTMTSTISGEMPNRNTRISADSVHGSSGSNTVTQASQARDQLLIQDREEAAIVINVTTMSPQTAYSTPRVVWRPDGSGVYVSSDDGIIRGFEASTGKLLANLQGHEAGSKVRCLCSGRSRQKPDQEDDQSPQNEYLVSGGFDQSLVLWHTA